VASVKIIYASNSKQKMNIKLVEDLNPSVEIVFHTLVIFIFCLYRGKGNDKNIKNDCDFS
jgi:hypothetical protein